MIGFSVKFQHRKDTRLASNMWMPTSWSTSNVGLDSAADTGLIGNQV